MGNSHGYESPPPPAFEFVTIKHSSPSSKCHNCIYFFHFKTMIISFIILVGQQQIVLFRPNPFNDSSPSQSSIIDLPLQEPAHANQAFNDDILSEISTDVERIKSNDNEQQIILCMINIDFFKYTIINMFS